MTGMGIVFAILLYTGWRPEPIGILIGFLTGFLGSASAMIINDVVDYRVDAVNKPWKPIPSGKVDPGVARYLSMVFLALAISINISLGLYPLLTALIYGLTGYLYSFMRRFWWSHFLVAFSTTSPIIYGYTVAGSPREYLVLAVMFSLTIYVATLGREVVKAWMDIEGDKRYGYVTIPLRYGVDATKKIIVATALTAPMLALLTGYLAHTSIYYYVLMLVSSTIYVIYMVKTVVKPDKKNMEKTRRYTLYAMMLGLLAFLLSKT